MKSVFRLIIAAVLTVSTAAAAATAKKKKAAKKSSTTSSSPNSKLSTDINFNDSVLHGRYQTPEETTARVEDEKLLSDLLAVRTHFKDRLKKSSEQN